MSLVSHGDVELMNKSLLTLKSFRDCKIYCETKIRKKSLKRNFVRLARVIFKGFETLYGRNTVTKSSISDE